jgi:tetratricopeptide (TPR) repeat protein
LVSVAFHATAQADAADAAVSGKPAPVILELSVAIRQAAEELGRACADRLKVAVAAPQDSSLLDGYVGQMLSFHLSEAGAQAFIVRTAFMNQMTVDMPEGLPKPIAARVRFAGGEACVLFSVVAQADGYLLSAAAYSADSGHPLIQLQKPFRVHADLQPLLDGREKRLPAADVEWLGLFARIFQPCDGKDGTPDRRLALAEGRYMFSMGLWEAAAERYVKLAAGEPTMCLVNAVFALQCAENAEKAAALIEASLKQHPDSGPLYALKAWLLLRRGAADDAALLLEQARLSDVGREGFYWMARYLLAIERDDRGTAQKAMDKMLELLPGEAFVLTGAARFFWRSAQMDKAADYYRRAIEAGADTPSTWNEYGLALDAGGKQDEAIAAFRKAVALDPSDAGVASHLADLLRARGRHVDALDVLRQAAEARPDRVDLLASYADAALAAWRLDEAERAYGLALERDPSLLSARIGLARTLSRRRQYAAARKLLEGILEGQPNCPLARMALAAVLAAEGRADDAVEALKAAALSPEHEFEARLALSRLYTSLGRAEEAVRNAQIAVAARPDALSYALLAHAFSVSGDRENADSALKKALECQPKPAEALLTAARVEEAREQYEAALTLARNAVEADPYCVDAHVFVGRLALRLGNAEECAGAWKRALTLDQWDAELHWELAEVLRTRLGDTKGAADHYRQHVRLEGSHVVEAKEILSAIGTLAPPR